MKRANLVLDVDLLRQAQPAAGTRTCSATVNLALAEMIRIRKIQSISQFFGRGLWEGNLAEMREDNPPRRPGSAKAIR
ncbi:MAG TPA: type II toxin-antitoxin system VapB family antitoxin [Terriglobales bacterium]|nr:type II toxin-antitoxin system VapB family antitoxin [Terriglobales bacterium]